ncbi:MAG: hypothetical protein ABIS26_02565 [Candidatus Paceibacterota bacterium]
MSKKSTITNLLVIPLMGSAILLSNPVMAAGPTQDSRIEVRHKTNIETPKKGIAGTVTSINGNIIVVTTKDNIKYTVDASSANIMKATEEINANPLIINISDIKVGDAIFVRGEIDNEELAADNIVDGKIFHKHINHGRENRHLGNGVHDKSVPTLIF